MSEVKQDIRKVSTINSMALATYMMFGTGGSAILSRINERGILQEIFGNRLLVSGISQYLVAFPFSMFIIKIIADEKNSPKLKDVLRKPQASGKEIARWIVISLFLVYAMSYISNILFGILQSATGIELHAVDFTAPNTAIGRISNILIIMFLAPIFEEILFRGMLVKNFEKYGTWSSIIAMGITFGLFHMNYEQTLYTSVLGVCAGFLIVKTKSIYSSLLLHFCLNTIGAIQSLFIGNIDMEKVSSGDGEYIQENISNLMPILLNGMLIFVIMIVGLIFFILELKNHKDTFQLESKYPELSEKKKLGIYFSTPLTGIATALFISTTIFNALM